MGMMQILDCLCSVYFNTRIELQKLIYIKCFGCTPNDQFWFDHITYGLQFLKRTLLHYSKYAFITLNKFLTVRRSLHSPIFNDIFVFFVFVCCWFFFLQEVAVLIHRQTRETKMKKKTDSSDYWDSNSRLQRGHRLDWSKHRRKHSAWKTCWQGVTRPIGVFIWDRQTAHTSSRMSNSRWLAHGKGPSRTWCWRNAASSLLFISFNRIYTQVYRPYKGNPQWPFKRCAS